MSGDARPRRIDCVLIAGGKYHDIDYARLELLTLLSDWPNIRTRVFEDYENVAALQAADMIVSYTCDVVPSLGAQEALRRWVERGGRWHALHGTNAILRFLGDGRADCPNWAPLHMDTLGAQFIAHPPIAPFTVEVADAAHPLVAGVEPFETTDEIYLMERRAELHVLLDCAWGGEAAGFVERDWRHARHPVMWLRRLGEGAVLYNTLGHCRGHYDLQPLADWWSSVDRCAWDLPVFRELVRRGMEWGMGR